MLSLLVFAARCSFQQPRDRVVAINYAGPGDFHVRFSMFEHLHPDCEEGGVRSGGAIKVITTHPAVFYTYVNYFTDCGVFDSFDGGAVHFVSTNGVVYMYRNCGHLCNATCGSFVTVTSKYAEVNQSTYLLCSYPGANARQSSTSLNGGDIIFQNHNVSYNDVYYTGSGLGTYKMTRLRAYYCTFMSNTGATNVINSHGTNSHTEYISYCNLLNNTASVCLIGMQAMTKAMYIDSCVFMKNKIAGGIAIGIGHISRCDGSAYLTDCYFDVSYTIQERVFVQGNPNKYQGTHRIEHLQTHECKAEFPLSTDRFTEDPDVYESFPLLLFALCVGIIEASNL